LSSLLDTDPEISKLLKENYVLVLVDVDKGHNQDVVTKYQNPTRFGLPVLVVTDKDGKMLTTKDTSELEQGNAHDPLKVKAFLEQWKPKR
jgi:hypothetical protein